MLGLKNYVFGFLKVRCEFVINIYFTKTIEDLIKIDENTSAKDLNDIIKRLASIISNSWVRIAEAGQNGRHQIASVLLRLLLLNKHIELSVRFDLFKSILIKLFQERWHKLPSRWGLLFCYSDSARERNCCSGISLFSKSLGNCRFAANRELSYEL